MAHDWFCFQPNNQPDLVDNQSDNNEQHLELNSGARKVKSNKRFFYSISCLFHQRVDGS